MIALPRHEIAKIKAAIRSYEQQLSFNPNSECNKEALQNAKAELEIWQARA